jgi:hypothetical protein
MKFSYSLVRVLLLAGFFSYSPTSFPWGQTGHRVVGHIAQSTLSPATTKKIKLILGGESLARVSIWPDKIKSAPKQYSHTFSWHYTNWPKGQDKYKMKNNQGQLIEAIHNQIKILKKKQSSKKDKAQAIKFLVHLIGDLHQPLHVGNGLDRGGNTCQVLFHKKRTNLHRLWDTGMIDFTQLSYTELANFLKNKPQAPVKLLSQIAILNWARESKNLRKDLYPNEQGKRKNNRQKLPNYCQKDHSLSDDELPQLGYTYSYRFMPIVEKRLLQAGIRLGSLLENIFNSLN